MGGDDPKPWNVGGRDFLGDFSKGASKNRLKFHPKP
jgi:hypothetical protein